MKSSLVLLALFAISVCTVSAVSSNCICPLVYFPICAANGDSFENFSNECFARCANYHFAYTGECISGSQQKAPECISSCERVLGYVCGQKGNNLRTIPNKCIADCQDFTITKSGTCDNKRVLGLMDWVKTAKTAITEVAGNIKDKVKEATQSIKNTTKNIINDIKNKTNEVVEKVKDKVEDIKNKTNIAIEEVKDKVEDIKDKVKDAAEKLKNDTKNAAESFANKTKEIANKIANKTKEVAKKIANKTKEAAQKISNKTKHFVNRTKEFFKKLSQRIVTRLRETKEGIENCTCHLLDRTHAKAKELIEKFERQIKETAEEVKNGTIKALNKTKNAIKKVWNQARDGLIQAGQFVLGWGVLTAEKIANNAFLIKTRTQNAFHRSKLWFKNLLGCGCTREYKPVCVEADNGEEATMLNLCYANCGELKVTNNNGACDVKKAEEEIKGDQWGLLIDMASYGKKSD